MEGNTGQTFRKPFHILMYLRMEKPNKDWGKVHVYKNIQKKMNTRNFNTDKKNRREKDDIMGHKVTCKLRRVCREKINHCITKSLILKWRQM